MNVSASDRAKKTGGRIAIALFSLLIGAFTVVCSAQVLYQGFSTKTGPSSIDCRSGLRGLARSLERARAEASAALPGERTRLAQFRVALAREWSERDEIEKLCENDSWATKALSQIDRLRWAEEQAVRYESADLAPSRKRVLAIEKTLDEQQSNKP